MGMTSFPKSERTRNIVYWITTALLLSELILGGVWDVLRVPRVRGIVVHLGYPAYFLVILGVWKLLGAIALTVPRFPRLKEWAYAGVVFNFTGALASHFAAGAVDVRTLASDRNDGGHGWILGSPPASRRNFPVR